MRRQLVKDKCSMPGCRKVRRCHHRVGFEAGVQALASRRLRQCWLWFRADRRVCLHRMWIWWSRRVRFHAVLLHVRHDLVGYLGQHLLGQQHLTVVEVVAETASDELTERHKLPACCNDTNTRQRHHGSKLRRNANRIKTIYPIWKRWSTVAHQNWTKTGMGIFWGRVK